MHSRLIGERVQVRIFADHLEVWYAQSKVDSFGRLRGRGRHQINYRHVIDWLVRKPGAFADYRYRDDLFPTSRFRMAFDALSAAHTRRVATRKYLEILQLAARQSETGVDDALIRWLDSDGPLTPEQVRQDVLESSGLHAPREIRIDAVNLSSFDELLSTTFFSSNQEGYDDTEVIEINIAGGRPIESAREIEPERESEPECEPESGHTVKGTSLAVVP